MRGADRVRSGQVGLFGQAGQVRSGQIRSDQVRVDQVGQVGQVRSGQIIKVSVCVVTMDDRVAMV